MQPVLERGSIDKPLTFDVGLIQLSFIPVCSPNIYMQHFSQIARRVCTLVLFIITGEPSLIPKVPCAYDTMIMQSYY